MLFTQLFLTLLMNALQQSLCFLEVTLLLGRRTPKTLSSNGFQRLGQEQHTRNQNLLIFSTNSLLDFIFLTPSQCLRVASPATVQQRLWWPRWLLGTCFAHASVSHVNTGFGKKCLRLDFKSTTEYNSHQIFACNSFLYDCESTPRKV